MRASSRHREADAGPPYRYRVRRTGDGMVRRTGTPRLGRPPSQRQLRIGEELRHALSHILQRGELRDRDLAGRSITVTEIRVSPDLRAATVFVMPLGGTDRDRTVEALKRASGYLRGCLARDVVLKYVPQLNFETDDSFDKAARIQELLLEPDVAADLVDGQDSAAEDRRG